MQKPNKPLAAKRQYQTPTLHKVGSLKTITLKVGSVADGLTERGI